MLCTSSSSDRDLCSITRESPEADYNVKIAADGKRKTTCGYKMHANTNEDGFVKKMTYIPGNVHDSKEFDKLLGKQKQ
jgi:IS5 family transposase